MLQCTVCGTQVKDEKLAWRCACGGPFVCDPSSFHYNPDDKLPGLWRYSSSLPVTQPEKAVRLGEGMTPLVACAWEYGEESAPIYCKFDGLNPTGSYKDRGVAVQISRLKELGLQHLVEDSSGNAGAAMAAYAGAANIQCEIFVPESTSEGKCVQITAYGATLRRIPGPREATTVAAEEAAKHTYYASHNWNPYFAEGIKTYAFEIFEQLGCAMPDNVIVPVGQGSLVLGAWNGFSEIIKAGKGQKMPRLFGVQSVNCSPLYEAWKNGEKAVQPFAKKLTIAEGIASAIPVKGERVLDVVRQSKGAFTAVTEKEIWSAFEKMARQGLYAEPTSAAAFAGASRLLSERVIKTGECTVVLLSGMGLKGTDKIMELRANPPQ